MGVRIPRITLKADYGDDSSFGELNLISLGYGLHQAWVYATMFATGSLFGTQNFVAGLHGSHASFAYLVSIVVFGLCLLTASATDQRFLKFYVSKKTLVAGALLMSCGTALLLVPNTASFGLEIVSGVATGIGSAALILFWGVAFAKRDPASIVLNSALAIAVGFGVYALILRHLPFPFGGLLAAALPLIELAILWKKTPAPFQDRNAVPLFKPLPVNKARFIVRFGAPVFVLGLALGTLRQTSIQTVLPASTTTDQIVMLLAAGCATVLILITILALGGAGRWNRFFRPLVPFIAATMFFLPFSASGDMTFANFFLIIAYMCFEALMWIFFGELAQRFRLSPIFVYGLGRGLLALAALTGSLFPVLAIDWIALMPFGENGVIVIILVAMVIAYALLPDEREIEPIIIPCPLVKAVSAELSDNRATLGAHPPVGWRFAGTDKARDAAPVCDESESEHDRTTTAASDAAHCSGASDDGRGRRSDFKGSTAPSPSPTRQIGSDSLQRNPSAGPDDDYPHRGRFKTKIEAIANTYLLSRRETEILFFLAKGLNSASIQEKLYISEGTAKTHIRHIYKKLDVHSQQELMRLVELTEIAC